MGCFYPPPTPTPGHRHRPTPTSLPSASPKHTVSALPRRPSGDYRYRPARHHVTMLWRDSTKLECRADPWSEWLSRLNAVSVLAVWLLAGSNPAPTFFDFRRSSWNYVTRQHFTGRGGRVAGLGRVFSYTSQKLSIGGTYFSQCKTWRIRARWISR